MKIQKMNVRDLNAYVVELTHKKNGRIGMFGWLTLFDRQPTFSSQGLMGCVLTIVLELRRQVRSALSAEGK